MHDGLRQQLQGAVPGHRYIRLHRVQRFDAVAVHKPRFPLRPPWRDVLGSRWVVGRPSRLLCGHVTAACPSARLPRPALPAAAHALTGRAPPHPAARPAPKHPARARPAPARTAATAALTCGSRQVDSSRQVCYNKCHRSCATCSGPYADECLSCAAPAYLLPNSTSGGATCGVCARPRTLVRVAVLERAQHRHAASHITCAADGASCR